MHKLSRFYWCIYWLRWKILLLLREQKRRFDEWRVIQVTSFPLFTRRKMILRWSLEDHRMMRLLIHFAPNKVRKALAEIYNPVSRHKVAARDIIAKRRGWKK